MLDVDIIIILIVGFAAGLFLVMTICNKRTLDDINHMEKKEEKDVQQ